MCKNVIDYIGERKALTLRRENTVAECVAMMLEEGVHRIWIQEEKLEGVVTMTDLLSLFLP